MPLTAKVGPRTEASSPKRDLPKAQLARAEFQPKPSGWSPPLGELPRRGTSFEPATAATRNVTFERDPAFIRRAARISLDNVRREDPHETYSPGSESAELFRGLHPAFYGSYDWHASVFNHWAMVRTLNTLPDAPERRALLDVLEDHFSEANLRAEHRNLGIDPQEATYGMAWLLRLAAEVRASPLPEARAWSERFAPLADKAKRILLASLRQLGGTPNVTNVHQNTAFSLAQALDYARATGDEPFRRQLTRLALRLFPPERAHAFHEDRSRGFGFIAPYLSQADLMRRVLDHDAFQRWFEDFFPRFPKGWQEPDLSWEEDGHYRDHKWGLMFHKAAALRGVASALGSEHPLYAPFLDIAQKHARTARAKLAGAFDAYDAAGYGKRLDLGDDETELDAFMDAFYAPGHWLPAYALYEQSGVGL